MENQKLTFITKSFDETQRLGEKLSQDLKNKNLIALYGELGSGKTTFVQGLAKGFGIKKIISPTFIIIRTYRLNIQFQISNFKFQNFYHIDLYRINNFKDIEGLGIMELMSDPENIVVIEWAEKIKSLLPEKRIDIDFKYLSGDKREITINF